MASGSTRRSATVTISVPEATSACSICSSERKPPVPTISREPQPRSPSAPAPRAAALDRRQHLDLLPSLQRRRPPSSPRGTTSPSSATATPRAAGRPPAARTASARRRAVGQLPRLAVQLDPHPAPQRLGSARRCGEAARIGPAGEAPPISAGHGLGGQRRQQDAVAVVAGREQQAVERAAARPAAGCPGCPGAARRPPRPAPARRRRAAAGRPRAAARARRPRSPPVEAALLDRRADDQRPSARGTT